MLMDKYKKTGDVIREYLESVEKENELINLYPEETKEYLSEETDIYNDILNASAERMKSLNYVADFRAAIREELLVEALYTGLLKPVLEAQLMKSKQQEFGKELVRKFVDEQGPLELLSDFKYKNLYLSEMAYYVNKETESVLEECEERIKEGLSERDAYSIEDGNINNLILDIKDSVPRDITTLIKNRVEDALVDFVDDNKKNKAEINSIYDNANNTIAMNSEDEMIQQEALSIAKRQEYEIINRNTNLLGAMSQLMLESAYKMKPLNEYYSDGNNGVDFRRVLDDTKVMYSFLECLNTLNIIPVTEEYIAKMLNEMKVELDEVATSNTSVSTIDPKTMQQKSKDDDENEDIDNKTIQNSIAPKGQVIK